MNNKRRRRRRAFNSQQLFDGVRAGDRALLGRAITLIESQKPSDQDKGQSLLQDLMPFTGQGLRVGITGVPGVGKSTLIERLGELLILRGHRVAVLTIDPSSTLTGGSILGDKTRMPTLANNPAAFIRPSPSSGSLGGVARKTRETMLLCEAAGYDVVLVETVGVGQSEVVVAGMVDFFLVLMLPGAGDELQGIKRGILELADMVAVNKAEGKRATLARRSASQYRNALRLLRRQKMWWAPPVLTCSGLKGEGLGDLWEKIEAHHAAFKTEGRLEAHRKSQQLRWMWQMIEDGLMTALRQDPTLQEKLPALESSVCNGEMPPTAAARQVLSIFTGGAKQERDRSTDAAEPT